MKRCHYYRYFPQFEDADPPKYPNLDYLNKVVRRCILQEGHEGECEHELS